MAYLRKPDNKKRGNPSQESGRILFSAKKVMPAARIAPLLTDSEDEASQQRHKKKLKDEMKRVSPNRQIVRELMKRTFPVRRREVLDGIGTVQEILSYYPALKSPEEVSRRAYSLLIILNTRLQLIREFNRTRDLKRSHTPRIKL